MGKVDTTPPSGGSSGGRDNGEPLGVAADYRGPTWITGGARPGVLPFNVGLTTGGGHAPRYYERHLDTPNSWDGPVIESMQADLIAAGLMSRSGLRPGVYDDRTRAAYKKLLEFANRQGINRADALQRLIEGTTRGGGGGPTRAPLVVQLTNPDTIRRLIDQTAPDIIGRRLSDAETQQLIGAYQSLESSAQRGAYNTATAGGTVTEPPDLQTFAEKKAKELHPLEADTFDRFRLGSEVLGILGLTGKVAPR